MKLNFVNIKHNYLNLCTALFMLVSCEWPDNDPARHVGQDGDSTGLALNEVAQLLSAIPLTSDHVREVHDAVTSSSGNGYDEEYTMKNLFLSPGAGVGDDVQTRVAGQYAEPLRDLIETYVRTQTRSSGTSLWEEPDSLLTALERSDIQIYWPYSDEWDGEGMPVLTFDPEDDSNVNIGFEVLIEDDGFRHVREVTVDEEMARKRPVWVVNRNFDAGFTSLEMLRRKDPAWGEGGGNIIVRSMPVSSSPNDGAVTKATVSESETMMKSLLLKDFTMNRHYDSWFCGASEFFVKTGSVENFTASTEAELRLYELTVTDFMIVVKRNQLGIPQPFNALLFTDWSEQMSSCAFMIIEDDGGTRTEWSGKAKVFVAGKSYGVEISFPLSLRDDIVWRGELTNSWIDRFNNEPGRFGDVNLTFEVLEY